ncbi:phytoene/squalene synthase family protein [Telmatospirillum sp.]|uniref:phytoene/squalene synthase family protein n=1 Tax=Telmatospirillum sp. TaxID=2079197 RepID=UPI002850FF13|nr:phytoene/squalene synthase family protein [Telmatospirillum sp.]MDR3436076.1 phytoene/squalene synthase family protein [Telmatospirillum sp.]
MSDNAPLSLLGDQVHRLDRDRFVTTLFAPADRREALFALHAFNIEVAQIRELVREPLLGRIRLQWWRDSLASRRAGQHVAHPVVDALGNAIDEFNLAPELFERFLTTRERDLLPEPLADMDALLSYADGTAGTVNSLALQVLGVSGAPADDVARSLGVAWGLTGLMRAFAFHARQGRVFLPLQSLAAEGKDMPALSKPSPGLASSARIIAREAMGHLAKARRWRRDLPRAAMPVLLTGRLAQSYLKALQKADFNLFDPVWSAPRPQPLGLFWRWLLGSC